MSDSVPTFISDNDAYELSWQHMTLLQRHAHGTADGLSREQRITLGRDAFARQQKAQAEKRQRSLADAIADVSSTVVTTDAATLTRLNKEAKKKEAELAQREAALVSREHELARRSPSARPPAPAAAAAGGGDHARASVRATAAQRFGIADRGGADVPPLRDGSPPRRAGSVAVVRIATVAAGTVEGIPASSKPAVFGNGASVMQPDGLAAAAAFIAESETNRKMQVVCSWRNPGETAFTRWVGASSNLDGFKQNSSGGFDLSTSINWMTGNDASGKPHCPGLAEILDNDGKPLQQTGAAFVTLAFPFGDVEYSQLRFVPQVVANPKGGKITALPGTLAKATVHDVGVAAPLAELEADGDDDDAGVATAPAQPQKQLAVKTASFAELGGGNSGSGARTMVTTKVGSATLLFPPMSPDTTSTYDPCDARTWAHLMVDELSMHTIVDLFSRRGEWHPDAAALKTRAVRAAWDNVLMSLDLYYNSSDSAALAITNRNILELRLDVVATKYKDVDVSKMRDIILGGQRHDGDFHQLMLSCKVERPKTSSRGAGAGAPRSGSGGRRAGSKSRGGPRGSSGGAGAGRPRGCKRCGRTNHASEDCYARKDIHGNVLDFQKGESAANPQQRKALM